MADSGKHVEPIGDDELLYRRVPVSTGWYDPATQELSPRAFHPHAKQDTTGISLSRSRYQTVQQAAQGRPGKRYYVAVLQVKDLRKHGIAIEPRPTAENPGHVELPALRSENRRSNEAQELERLLSELTVRVEGPF